MLLFLFNTRYFVKSCLVFCIPRISLQFYISCQPLTFSLFVFLNLFCLLYISYIYMKIIFMYCKNLWILIEWFMACIVNVIDTVGFVSPICFLFVICAFFLLCSHLLPHFFTNRRCFIMILKFYLFFNDVFVCDKVVNTNSKLKLIFNM